MCFREDWTFNRAGSILLARSEQGMGRSCNSGPWDRRHLTVLLRTFSYLFKWDMRKYKLSSFLQAFGQSNILKGHFELPSCNHEETSLKTESNMLRVAEKEKKNWPSLMLSHWINLQRNYSSSRLFMKEDTVSLLLRDLSCFYCFHLNVSVARYCKYSVLLWDQLLNHVLNFET